MTWQPAGIVVPDVEQVLTAYLRAALVGRPESYAQNVWVDNGLPTAESMTRLGRAYPDRIVALRRDGGQALDVRDQPRVSVRVWCTRETDAVDLAALTNALLRLAPGNGPVLSASIQSGPYAIPEDGPLFLRYSLFEFTTRGVQVT